MTDRVEDPSGQVEERQLPRETLHRLYQPLQRLNPRILLTPSSEREILQQPVQELPDEPSAHAHNHAPGEIDDDAGVRQQLADVGEDVATLVALLVFHAARDDGVHQEHGEAQVEGAHVVFGRVPGTGRVYQVAGQCREEAVRQGAEESLLAVPMGFVTCRMLTSVSFH